MHVHLPKPLHGWRAFVGEVGIIVLGVLIALGAGQIAESAHESREGRQADEVIRIISARKADRDELKQYQWWLR